MAVHVVEVGGAFLQGLIRERGMHTRGHHQVGLTRGVSSGGARTLEDIIRWGTLEGHHQARHARTLEGIISRQGTHTRGQHHQAVGHTRGALSGGALTLEGIMRWGTLEGHHQAMHAHTSASSGMYVRGAHLRGIISRRGTHTQGHHQVGHT
jgi:hypothetical protein